MGQSIDLSAGTASAQVQSSLNSRIQAQENKTRPVADRILRTNYFNKVLDRLEMINEDVLSTNDITYTIKGTNTIVFIEVKERTCDAMRYNTDVLDMKKVINLQKKVNAARLKGWNAKAFYLALFPSSKQAIMYSATDLNTTGRIGTFYSKEVTYKAGSPVVEKSQYEFSKTEGHLFNY